jgi:copper chaperone CopZ
MEVGDLEGVSSVVADEKNKTAVIVYDAPATEEKIKTLLAEINYQVAE